MFLNIGTVCARTVYVDNFDDGFKIGTFWDSVHVKDATYEEIGGYIDLRTTVEAMHGGAYLISKPIQKVYGSYIEFDAKKVNPYHTGGGAFGIAIRKTGNPTRDTYYGMPVDNSIIISCLFNPSELVIFEYLNPSVARSTSNSSVVFNADTWYNIGILIKNSTCIEIYKNNTLCHTQILNSSYSSWLSTESYIVIELFGRDFGADRHVYVDNFRYADDFSIQLISTETEIVVASKNTKIFDETLIQVENVIRIIDKIKTVILAGVEAYGTIIKSITAILTYDTPPDIMSLIRLTLQIFTYEKGLQQIISAFTIIKSSMGILFDLIVNINTYYDGTTPYPKTPATILGNILVVVVMLIVPPLLVSNYFGKIATIPMFYFMSVICYITSLIPLSIFILITIGIVALFFIKRRSEQNA